MSAKHAIEGLCPSCAEKLAQAHPDLRVWFLDLKSRNPSVHVSWSYRDQDSQEQAFAEGRTQLHFPKSAHNQNPSLALDIFQLNDKGCAVFDPIFCAKVASEIRTSNLPMIWGGNFKSIGDNDHFQLHSDI